MKNYPERRQDGPRNYFLFICTETSMIVFSMRAKGRHYSPKEKADAALDACREAKALAELSAESPPCHD